MNDVNQDGLALTARGTFYGIERHQHLFAAWAASRAAMVAKGHRFRVEQGRAILEACGFNAEYCKPEQLPEPRNMDEKHREWRENAIKAADSYGLQFTHGVAAKLINIYLKSRFVCGGYLSNERVQNLHPPIDAVLLDTLADLNIGGFAKQWRQASRTRWSNLSSEQYEQVITLIRVCLNGEPLWKIEEHWQGNQ